MKSSTPVLILFLTLLVSCSTKRSDTATTLQDTHTGQTISTKSERFARMNEERTMLQDPSTGKVPVNMRERELQFLNELESVQQKNLTNTAWESRGPFNVGGRTRAVVMDRTDENILMAGAASGGVWRSTDAGESWEKVSSNTSNLAVTCLIQDPRDGHEQDWYYGTGELFGASQGGPGAFYTGAGIYKTSDNGATWESLPGSFTAGPQFTSTWQGIWNIAIDPSNQDTTEIYAATYGNIRRSINDGASFQTVLDSDNASGTSYFTDVHVNDAGVVYAACSRETEIISFGLGPNGGIHRSVDGVNFVNILPDNFHTAYSRIVMAEDPSDSNHLMFLCANVDTLSGFEGEFFNGGVQYYGLWDYTYISGDGSEAGGQWQDLSANLPDGNGPFDDFYAQSGYDLCIAIKPDDPSTVFIGGTNLYRSTDGFTSNSNTMQIGGYGIGSDFPEFKIYDNHHPDIHGFGFLASDANVLINYNDGGIYRTDNCLQDTVEWTSLNNGYLTTQVYGLAVDKNTTDQKIVAGFQDNGNFFVNSADPEAPWTLPLNGDGCYSAFSSAGDFILMSIQNGRIFKMNVDDNGTVIGQKRIDPDVDDEPYEFIHPYALDPNDDDLLYLPYGNKLQVNNTVSSIAVPNELNYDTYDDGWFTLADSLDAGQVLTAISATEGAANRVYLGTSSRSVYRVDDASDINSPLVDITFSQFPNAHVDCIAVDPLNDDRAMVVFTNYGVYSLWMTEDAGLNWEKVAGNLEQNSSGVGNGPSCRWARIHPLPSGDYQYFVGTSIGLFTTNDINGLQTNWYRAAPDLLGNNVFSYVDSRVTDNMVIAGSHGGGVFSAQIDQVVSTVETDREPSIELYPNPSADFLILQMPESPQSNAVYSVISANGQLIMSGRMTQKSKRLNTSSLAIGSYTIRLEVDNKMVTKPFVVSR